jgi:hypothetical protein
VDQARNSGSESSVNLDPNEIRIDAISNGGEVTINRDSAGNDEVLTDPAASKSSASKNLLETLDGWLFFRR